MAGFSGGLTVRQMATHLDRGELECHDNADKSQIIGAEITALATAGLVSTITNSATFIISVLADKNPSIKTASALLPDQIGNGVEPTGDGQKADQKKLYLPDFDVIVTGIGEGVDKGTGQFKQTTFAKESVFYQQYGIGGGADVDGQVVGEMLYQRFDSQGQELENLTDRFVALPLKQLRNDFVNKDKTVMLLAAGMHLSGPVLAAYRGGLFNMLICDDTLAVALYKLWQTQKKKGE